jgi:hypothetical protein
MTDMEFISDRYCAIVREGMVSVTSLTPDEVRETTFLPDGGIDVKIHTKDTSDKSIRKLLYARSRRSVFSACWAGGKNWNVDMDCGAQRFNGTKPENELKKAFHNCGFTWEQTKQIIADCKSAGTQDFCPHEW